MATPARLVQLSCPKCVARHWEIDNDYREANLFSPGDEASYEQRPYLCPACGWTGAGYAVLEKSPPEFFLQPHPLYPMSVADFDRWLAVLRANFPDNPMLQYLGTEWYPGSPHE
jgi:hypothetical protein